MIRDAISAAPRILLGLTAFLASGQTSQTTSASICEPAPPADRRPSADGLLLARRDCLRAEAASLRNQRRNKAASICEADLSQVVLECLRRGL